MASAAEASAESVAAVPGARRVSLADLTGEEPSRDPQDSTVVAKPAPAMPLTARAAATAEAAGAAQRIGGEAAQDKGEDEGPSTAETEVVAAEPPPLAQQRVPPATLPPAWEEPEHGEAPPVSAQSAVAPVRGARAAAREEPPVLAPATAAGSRPRYPPPPAEAGRADPVGATARVSAAAAAGGGGATLRRERRSGADDGADGPGHSGSTLRLAVIAVVLVGVIVLVASQLLSGGSSTPPASTTSTQSTSGPAPSSVTVAVLNGTTEGGLAGRVAATLSSKGYRRGAVANAPTQNHTSTVIEYTSGNRNAAIEVAIALALTPAQVVPASGATLAAASQSGASPTAIVLLGSNYAQQ